MTEGNKKQIRAMAAMFGAIVGTGVFGIPYAFAQSGFWIGLVEILLIGALLIVLQMLYAEITIQTPGHCRLGGLAKKYLGTKWKWLATALMFGTVWGAMVAYVIIAGQFLWLLLGPIFGGEPFIYSAVFFVVEAIFLWFGLKFIARAETAIVLLLLFLFGVIIVAGVPHVDTAHLMSVNWDKVLLPYGVILFAMAGLGITPEMHDILGEKHERKMFPAVIITMSVILLLYIAFAVVVMGASGNLITDDALSGLGVALGPTIAVLGSLLGSITLISVFMVAGIEVKDTLLFDFKMKNTLAWALTIGVPGLLFFLGLREFITVISFTGAVFGSATAVVIIAIYSNMLKKMKKRKSVFRVPMWILAVIAFVFIAGALAEIGFSIFG